MGSGIFPISHQRHPKQAETLHLAANLIGDVLTWSADQDVEDSSNGQWDNARSDGGALARLQLARDLILGEVNPPKEAKDRADPSEPR